MVMDSREGPHLPALPSPSPPPPPPPPNINMMMAPNSYPSSLPNSNLSSMINPNSVSMMSPGALFSFNSMLSPASKPLDSLNAGPYDGSLPGLRPSGVNIELPKKKRGRPRKYAPDDNIGLGLASTTVSSSVGQGEASGGTTSSEPPLKRSRGRPPGSGKKQLAALGAGRVGFMPQVITVKAGEDIVSKIIDLSPQEPNGICICILSASGAIYNVTVRQPDMSGGLVTYEGRYGILLLSGYLFLSQNNGSRSRTGDLNVALLAPDGRMFGGLVSGVLVAATTVQVIAGSFSTDARETDATVSKSGTSLVPPSNMLKFRMPSVAGSPPSQGGSSEASDVSGSNPMNPMPAGIYGNANQTMQSMQMYQIWNGQNQQ